MRKTDASLPPQFNGSEESSMFKTLFPKKDVKVRLPKDIDNVSLTKKIIIYMIKFRTRLRLQ